MVPHADERVRDEGAEEDIRAEYGGNIMMMMMMMIHNAYLRNTNIVRHREVDLLVYVGYFCTDV